MKCGGTVVSSCNGQCTQLQSFDPLLGALCCVLGQDTLLSTVSLSTQMYKWILANLMLGVIRVGTSIPFKGEKK